jgi:hypothetical protein
MATKLQTPVARRSPTDIARRLDPVRSTASFREYEPRVTELGVPSALLVATITLTIDRPVLDEVGLARLAVSSLRHHLALELYRQAPLLATFYEFDVRLVAASAGSLKVKFEALLRFKDELKEDFKKAGRVGTLTFLLMLPSAASDSLSLAKTIIGKTEVAVQQDVPQCRPTIVIDDINVYNITIINAPVTNMPPAPSAAKKGAPSKAKQSQGVKKSAPKDGRFVLKEPPPAPPAPKGTGSTKGGQTFPRGGKSFDL